MDDLKPADDSDSKRTSAAFWIAIGLFGSYATFLILLAFSTANPILLSPRQLRNAHLIVRGKVEKIEEGEVIFRVEELFRGENAPETLRLRGLSIASLNVGEEWVLPLSILERGEFMVTPLNFDSKIKQPLLIYPADSATIANLKSRLSSEDPSP